MPEGRIFGYDALGLERSQYAAAAKALERLVAKGVLRRQSKGQFFRPKKTPFGDVGPSESEIIRGRLVIRGNQIGYITGKALYHRMGLTTQVPRVIQIASRSGRISINQGNVQARPVKSYVEVSADKVPLLELLDVLKDFRQIPDLDRLGAIRLLLWLLKEMDLDELGRVCMYAQAYPPRTRALLGALLDSIGLTGLAAAKITDLNPLTKYRMGIQPDELPTAPHWNIE